MFLHLSVILFTRGGLCPDRGPLSQGGLCPGEGLCPNGVLCPGRVFIHGGGVCRGDPFPPYSNVRVVHILLECILVMHKICSP